MKTEQPIQILSDNEEKQYIKQEAKKKIQQLKLQKVLLDRDFDIQIQVAKFFIEGTDEQKEQAIKNRILKFFNYKIDLIDGHFVPRFQPHPSNQPKLNPNQLILFGVDFLKTRTLRKMFPDADITWINDSNCKLTLPDPKQAKQLIKNSIKNKSQLEELQIKVQSQMSEENLPKGKINIYTGWIELTPYYQLNFQRKLFVRYATQEEKDVKKQQCNNYTAYQNAKKQFQLQLLQQKQIKEKYQQLLKKKPRQYRRIQNISHGGQRERSRDRHSYRRDRWNQTENNYSNYHYSHTKNTRKNNPQQQKKRKRIGHVDDNDDKQSKLSFSYADNVPTHQVHGIWLTNNKDNSDLSFEMDGEQADSRQDFSRTFEKLSMDNDLKNQNIQVEQNKKNDVLKRKFKDFDYSRYIEQTQKKQKQKSSIDIIVLDD